MHRLLLAILLAAADHPADEGAQLMKRGDWEAAARALRDAVEAHPERPGPHRELARALVKLREAGKTCETGATKKAILDQLAAAGVDKPAKAWAPVADTFRYLTMTGLDPHDDKALRTLLARPSWTGTGGEGTLDFRDDGTFSLGNRSGTWKIEAGAVTVPGGTMTLGADGVLDGPLGRFTDLPEECP